MNLFLNVLGIKFTILFHLQQQIQKCESAFMVDQRSLILAHFPAFDNDLNNNYY